MEGSAALVGKANVLSTAASLALRSCQRPLLVVVAVVELHTPNLCAVIQLITRDG